jgi:hypothetical protein
VAGVQASRRWSSSWWGHAVENTAGVQLRNDDIPSSGLNHTTARRLVAVWIDDRVDEASAAVHAANRIRWTPWLRSQVGLRGDLFGVAVTSNTSANSGQASAGLVSPKLGLVLGPFGRGRRTELYADVGAGFHSNDARGVVISVEPITQQAVRRAPLLVRTQGAEVGVRTSAAGLTTTLALWLLDSDSELTFQGDSGDTSARGPSRKLGVEWAATYRPVPWVMLNVDAAVTRARYRSDQIGADGNPGRYIANSIPVVVSAAAVVQSELGLFGGARLRYFGAQPLVEDDAVRQRSSTIASALIGCRHGRWEGSVEVLNLFDAQTDDIAYFYASRLAGEAAAVNDVHVHPAEPIQARATLTARF